MQFLMSHFSCRFSGGLHVLFRHGLTGETVLNSLRTWNVISSVRTDGFSERCADEIHLMLRVGVLAAWTNQRRTNEKHQIGSSI